LERIFHPLHPPNNGNGEPDRQTTVAQTLNQEENEEKADLPVGPGAIYVDIGA